MSRQTPYFELEQALAQPGCAICALALRELDRYFRGLVYEKVNNIGIRDAIRKAHGFCAAHGAMLREARSALGAAIIQRDVLRAVARQLDGPGAARQGGWRQTLFGERGAGEAPLGPAGSCPACQHAGSFARDWVELMLRHYDVLRPLLQASGGLCLPHVRVVLSSAQPATASFRADQLAIWARLEAELDEFIRKQDHEFAHEPAGPESDAWERAIALLAGDERVLGSPRASSG